MINLPYNEILKLIQDKTGMSQEDINSKVNDKLNQLSGLISKEGAAHIIANELNVELMPKEGEPLKIKNIPAGMRNLKTQGKVQQVYEVREFNSSRGPGKVASFLLGDESGVIRIVLWNDQIDVLEKLNQGDVVKIENAYSRDNNGRKEIHLNDASKVDVNPEGVQVNAVKRQEAPRKKISELSAEDNNVEVMGTIVQVFDIRFFEIDPNTRRRVKPKEDNKFYDSQGNEITPDYSYVSNIFIDDGSSNIRVVCFKNQLDNLLGKDSSQILEYRQSPESFEPVKHDLLGHIVKIRGRVVNNEMFNRLEIISNLIIKDPNPDEEIDRLKGSSQDSMAESPAEQTANQKTGSQDDSSGGGSQTYSNQPAETADTENVRENSWAEQDVPKNQEDSAGTDQHPQMKSEPEGPSQEYSTQPDTREGSESQQDSSEDTPDSLNNVSPEKESSIDEIENIEEDINNIDEEFFDEDDDSK